MRFLMLHQSCAHTVRVGSSRNVSELYKTNEITVMSSLIVRKLAILEFQHSNQQQNENFHTAARHNISGAERTKDS